MNQKIQKEEYKKEFTHLIFLEMVPTKFNILKDKNNFTR
jgi:hypothetical protein